MILRDDRLAESFLGVPGIHIRRQQRIDSGIGRSVSSVKYCRIGSSGMLMTLPN